MEQFQPKKREIPEFLKPEEIQHFLEICEIRDATYNAITGKDKVDKQFEFQNRLADFDEESVKNKIDPRQYLLWHMLIGSSDLGIKTTKLDTEDHKIENLIRSLYAEFKQ